MRITFRAHPIMTFRLLRPFLFVLILPLIKGLAQYLRFGTLDGILGLEIITLSVILAIAIARCLAFSVSLEGETVTVKSGLWLKSESVMTVSRLSCISEIRTIPDFIFGAVTYRINTEAGRTGRPDFEFKLRRKDAHLLSQQLYGDETREISSFSAVRIAAMAATSSSAVTGLLIAVPIINNVGRLLSISLSEMLFNEINHAASNLQTYFPPIVNVITLIFLASYTVSALVCFFKYINFRVAVGKERVEITSGLFVRRRTVFRKSAVNNVCIEQTPLMRLFRRYSVRAAIGGYGDAKGEKAIVVPSGSHQTTVRGINTFFPEFLIKGNVLRPTRSAKNRLRFYRIPLILALTEVALAAVTIIVFPYFDSLIVFVAIVALALTAYYSDLSNYNYHFGKISFGQNIYAAASHGVDRREFYCKKQSIGVIKIIQTPADVRFGTCKIAVTVRAESAERIFVRNVDVKSAVYDIEKTFNISGIKNFVE